MRKSMALAMVCATVFGLVGCSEEPMPAIETGRAAEVLFQPSAGFYDTELGSLIIRAPKGTSRWEEQMAEVVKSKDRWAKANPGKRIVAMTTIYGYQCF